MRIIEKDGTVTEVTGDIATFADGRVVKFETDWKKLRAKIQRAIDTRLRAKPTSVYDIEQADQRRTALYRQWLAQRAENPE
jgi:hypothetical protein